MMLNTEEGSVSCTVGKLLHQILEYILIFNQGINLLDD
jgi:hypothetical protein